MLLGLRPTFCPSGLEMFDYLGLRRCRPSHPSFALSGFSFDSPLLPLKASHRSMLPMEMQCGDSRCPAYLTT